jgi:hypothetical protein
VRVSARCVRVCGGVQQHVARDRDTSTHVPRASMESKKAVSSMLSSRLILASTSCNQ